MTTVREARDGAARRLRGGADPETAGLDADVLLAFALATTREAILAYPERLLTAAEADRLRALVDRRFDGEPVAYLRGWKEFYGLRFRVDPRVLIPRPETETLVEEALRVIVGRPVTVVDVGTGSGAIACAVAAHAPNVRVIATDASADALDVAAANALALGVAERIDLVCGDLLEPITERAALVCANLPYLRDDALADLGGARSSLAFEPRRAVVAGADGLDLIRRAVLDLRRVLVEGGTALFECDPPQAPAVATLLEREGLRARVIRDLAGSDRVVRGDLESTS
ncbi:MAG TPA: peptide chain release factor N(5)-glutamine methyltransferase [Candidatus Limnocylindrales bacterium]|nr:peptide chain release factor N(5)-glutamine methyltransferase [Candidatus Limnocylindrales bacterium]